MQFMFIKRNQLDSRMSDNPRRARIYFIEYHVEHDASCVSLDFSAVEIMFLYSVFLNIFIHLHHT